MTDITSIPLNKLTAWEGNVRKTQTKGGIDELAASIKAHGLLQSLVVRPHAPAWEKLPKAELAKEAERQIAGTGWMPLPLRSA